MKIAFYCLIIAWIFGKSRKTNVIKLVYIIFWIIVI